MLIVQRCLWRQTAGTSTLRLTNPTSHPWAALTSDAGTPGWKTVHMGASVLGEMSVYSAASRDPVATTAPEWHGTTPGPACDHRSHRDISDRCRSMSNEASIHTCSVSLISAGAKMLRTAGVPRRWRMRLTKMSCAIHCAVTSAIASLSDTRARASSEQSWAKTGPPQLATSSHLCGQVWRAPNAETGAWR